MENNTNGTNGTKYQVAIVGDSKYGAYAFHIEGHATVKPDYTEAKEGKKAFCRFGFAVNDNASWEGQRVMRTYTVTGKRLCL